MLTGGFKRQTSAAVPSPLAADSNNLSGSMRKRIVLNKQFISVQKEDGDIGHIEVKIGDEELSGVQPILRSLSEMGGIDNSSKPGSPVPGRGSLKDALRRGSQAMGLQDEQNQKIDVPQGQCHFLHISFSF